MRRLEEQLGEPLFARRGRGVELTAVRRAGGGRARRGPRRPRPRARAAAARRRRRQPVRARRDREPRRPGAPGADRRRPRADRRPPAAAARRPLVRARRAARARRASTRRSSSIRAATPGTRSRSGPCRCGGGRRPRSRAGRCPTRSRSSPTTRRAGCATSRCARLDELGLQPELTAESPHLSGVHAAVRNGLGYALLAAGGDGLRAVTHGPLAEAVPTTPLAAARARAPPAGRADARGAVAGDDAPHAGRGGVERTRVTDSEAPGRRTGAMTIASVRAVEPPAGIPSAAPESEVAEEQSALRRVATLVASGAERPRSSRPSPRRPGGCCARARRRRSATTAARADGRPLGDERRPRGFVVGTSVPLADSDGLTAIVARTGRPARIDDYARRARPAPPS